MAELTEAMMHSTLRRWLSQRGHDVFSEVSLETGIIDLVSMTNDGEVWGIEIKNHWNLVERGEVPDRVSGAEDATQIAEGKLREIVEGQLNKYLDAEALDRLFLATQNPAPLREEFNRDRRVPLTNDLSDPLNIHGRQDIPDEIGFIRAPPYPHDLYAGKLPQETPFCDAGKEVEIIDRGETKSVSETPSLPSDAGPEAELVQTFWEAFVSETIVLREGIIPNPDGSRPNPIDLVYFKGDLWPRKIYSRANPKTHGIVGIEVKADLSNPASVRAQLKRYLESGGLTELYLGVHLRKTSEAAEIVDTDELDDIGLVVVDHSGISRVEPATKLPLEYDGIRWKSGTEKVATVGWGKANLQREEIISSVYDQ